MKNPEKLWRDIAYRFAQQSKCKSRQVGAIIVTQDNHMIGQGYNGAPAGSDCGDCPRCYKKPESGTLLDRAICCHAEANAIAYAAKIGVSTKGCTLYSTLKPCLDCAKLIVGAGIDKVVYYSDYPDPNKLALKCLKNAGIKVKEML